jgi:hypothetical protein
MEPTQASMDDLTRGLLPTLLHGLGNCTQLISGFSALLEIPGGDEMLEGRASELGRTGDEVQRLGWLLAALSSASGAELMQTRRDPRGLVWMVDLVRDAARRAGRPLAQTGRSMPEVQPCSPDGWRVPWAVGSLLWAATKDSGGKGDLSWAILPHQGGWRCAVKGGATVGAMLDTLTDALPGAVAEQQSCGATTLDLPCEWLKDGA